MGYGFPYGRPLRLLGSYTQCECGVIFEFDLDTEGLTEEEIQEQEQELKRRQGDLESRAK